MYTTLDTHTTKLLFSTNSKTTAVTNNGKVAEEEGPAAYAYFKQQTVQDIHHFYLSSEIGEPALYVELLHTLNCACEHDVIILHINTEGGNLYTGIQIINAIRSCQGQVIASLESVAFSLGTIIFLAADNFIVHENCLMMFHNYSGGLYGKGNEQQTYLKAAATQFENIAKDIYKPFLTDIEIKQLSQDLDLYLQTKDIIRRLKRLIKEREKTT